MAMRITLTMFVTLYVYLFHKDLDALQQPHQKSCLYTRVEVK